MADIHTGESVLSNDPRSMKLNETPPPTDPSLHSCRFDARTPDQWSRRAPCGIRIGSSFRSTSSERSVRNCFACSRCPCTDTCSCCHHSPGSRYSPPHSVCTCRRTLRGYRSGTSEGEWRGVIGLISSYFCLIMVALDWKFDRIDDPIGNQIDNRIRLRIIMKSY